MGSEILNRDEKSYLDIKKDISLTDKKKAIRRGKKGKRSSKKKKKKHSEKMKMKIGRFRRSSVRYAGSLDLSLTPAPRDGTEFPVPSPFNRKPRFSTSQYIKSRPFIRVLAFFYNDSLITSSNFYFLLFTY